MPTTPQHEVACPRLIPVARREADALEQQRLIAAGDWSALKARNEARQQARAARPA